MRKILPARVNRQPKLSEFTSEELHSELLRLSDTFLPEFKLPKIDINIGKRIYTKAALTYYKRNLIVMFKPYHDRFSFDYKSTLLHELGHLIADNGHGDNFKKYYTLLRDRQQSISEQVIPDSYSDFLFCRVSNHYTRKYSCIVCGDVKVYRKRMNSICKPCRIPMLEDTFFEGIEAIIPQDVKETVDRSIVGVGKFTKKDVIFC